MASPIGHALAGIAVAWGADLVSGNRTWRTAPPSASWYRRAGNGLTLGCGVLAAAPDLDLFFGRFHRTATHSVTAVVVVAVIAAMAAARAGRPVARISCMCAGAWATHLVLDWLSADHSIPRGFQLLWPFDGTWFISGWNVFEGSERRRLLSAATMRQNGVAIAQELVLLLPIVVGLWLIRAKVLAGLAAELARHEQTRKVERVQ